MKKVAIIVGTRPEAIKLAPVIQHMRKSTKLECQVCVTGQHRSMLDQVMEIFNITVDHDLDVMVPNQTLSKLTAKLITKLDQYFLSTAPDAILVQGDTTTVFAAALTAFYHKISVGHVEAGLRTGNLNSPWPEEANRVLASRLARWHFAPTEANKGNLLRENVDEASIYVTGNTVIDALLTAKVIAKERNVMVDELPNFNGYRRGTKRMVLITGHRRENFGSGFQQIFKAISVLASKYPETDFVYPVHLNPNVCEPVQRALGTNESFSKNIYLIAPQPYLQFVTLMNSATLIITDSGGVQEEAPSLFKPVLVMRDTTERPEAVGAGTVELVGANTESIVTRGCAILDGNFQYKKIANPYGDGNASKRIVEIMEAGL